MAGKNDSINAFQKWQQTLADIQKLPFGPLQEKRNEEGALHCADGPAYISPIRLTHYINGRKHGPDYDRFGTCHYYYENIRIPKHYFTNPEQVTVEEVLANTNQEVRYVGLKIVGLDKVRKRAKIVHTEKKSHMELFQIAGVFSEPLTYLKVRNSTPELDGSFKDYFLCVPPTMKRCKQAVAWTFGLEENDYNPEQET